MISGKVSAISEDEPRKRTESDSAVDFCIDKKKRKLKSQKTGSFVNEINSEKLSWLMNKVKPVWKVSALSEEEPGSPESDSETGFCNNLTIGTNITVNIVNDQGCRIVVNSSIFGKEIYRVKHSVVEKEQQRG